MDKAQVVVAIEFEQSRKVSKERSTDNVAWSSQGQVDQRIQFPSGDASDRLGLVTLLQE
jgi:hypothetical protein